MKINYKKSLKFVTLLVTSLLIGLVSAGTFKYMYMDGSTTIGTQQLAWIQDGSPISGDTVTMTLDVEPGIPTDFNETLYLKEQGGTDHNLTMTVSAIVTAAKFEYYYMYIYENFTSPGSWQLVDSLDVKTLNDQYSTYTGNNPLKANSYYKLDFGIKANTGTSGTETFEITVKYE